VVGPGDTSWEEELGGPKLNEKKKTLSVQAKSNDRLEGARSGENRLGSRRVRNATPKETREKRFTKAQPQRSLLGKADLRKPLNNSHDGPRKKEEKIRKVKTGGQTTLVEISMESPFRNGLYLKKLKGEKRGPAR